MRQLFLGLTIILFTSSVSAQFLDVEKIGGSSSSRSIMFQEEEASVVDSKKIETPKQKQRVIPKKNTQVTNVSLFKPGDAKIMAVVNGEAISTSDIDSYAKIFMMNTGVPLNNKTKPMIINKVLQAAIDEKIKRQETDKNKMTLSDKELNDAISKYEQTHKLPRGKLMAIFKEKKINPDIFKEQMKTEIMWARMVRRKMMSESYVTQREVEDAIARSKEDMSSPKYKVSEIVIPVAKAKNADVLVENIRRDKIFNMYAAQFSQSPSSANGGSLGWLKEGQLPKPLENKIKVMKIGQVSEPVKYEGNYYILQLDDKFVPNGKMPEISFDDMRNVLEMERLEGYSAKYIQNLRQKSVIEFKG